MTTPSKDDEGEDEGIGHQGKNIPPVYTCPLETTLFQQDVGYTRGGEKCCQSRVKEYSCEGIVISACGLGSRGVIADESYDLDIIDEVELYLLELYKRRDGGGVGARRYQLTQKCRLLSPKWRVTLLTVAFTKQRIQSTSLHRKRS